MQQVLNIINTKTHLLNIGALSLLALLFVTYAYFLSSSVVQVVIRQEVQQGISDVQTQILALESKYIAAQYKVSDSVVSQAGYIAAIDKIYISEPDTSVVLSGPVQ